MMIQQNLISSYRLIAELLLYPEERDAEIIETELKNIQSFSELVTQPIEKFFQNPSASSLDEYIATLELSPPCPLYVGSYLYDEPNSCRGAGLSGRNGYMIELTNVYRHFGFEPNNQELPDFLPLMVEFLNLSLGKKDRDRIGLRRRFVEHYLLPALKPISDNLKKYESPYLLLIESLKAALAEDLKLMADQPIWEPQVKKKKSEVNLPILNEGRQ